MYTPYRTYEKKQSEIVVLSNIFEIQIVQAMENYSNAEKERSRFKGEESKRFKSILYVLLSAAILGYTNLQFILAIDENLAFFHMVLFVGFFTCKMAVNKNC